MDFSIVVVGIVVTALAVLSYQVNGLRQSKGSQLAPRVRREIEQGQALTVKHDRPRSLTPDGKECWGAGKRDFDCFLAFWYFADWINKLYSDLSEPIRLQELSNTAHTGYLSNEGPSYGRRYDIFYNRVRVGRLQVRAGILEDSTVDVVVETNFSPHDVPYEDIWGLSTTVAGLVTSKKKASIYGGGQTEYAYATSQIRDALIGLLLQSQREGSFSGFEITLSGTPDAYYQIVRGELERRAKQKAAASS